MKRDSIKFTWWLKHSSKILVDRGFPPQKSPSCRTRHFQYSRGRCRHVAWIHRFAPRSNLNATRFATLSNLKIWKKVVQYEKNKEIWIVKIYNICNICKYQSILHHIASTPKECALNSLTFHSFDFGIPCQSFGTPKHWPPNLISKSQAEESALFQPVFTMWKVKKKLGFWLLSKGSVSTPAPSAASVKYGSQTSSSANCHGKSMW